MKLIRLGQPASLEKLRMTTGEPRHPGPGEVLVRVRASSLNYHDYAVVTGRIPTGHGRAPLSDEGRVPLSDGAGEVVEVGPEVDCADLEPKLKPGDAVVSTFFPRWLDGPISQGGVPGDDVDGFACEYATVAALGLTRQPAGYTHAEAATLPCAALTAWRALMIEGALRPGQVVVVQGTGGVSLFALQFAKAAGAAVIATSSSDDKLQRLVQLGADHVINYRTHPQWAEAVADFTGGAGADHIIEVGGSGTLPQSLSACRTGGHIAMIGVLAGREGPVPTAMVMWKNIRLQGITVGSRRQQIEMLRAIETIGLRPVIDSHFPLDQIADAFRHQESGRHFGKIVVDI